MVVRVKNWSNKTMSQGGKEVSIKLILQAIPTYIMSCFLFPKFLCEELNSIRKNYWWKHNQGKKGRNPLDELAENVYVKELMGIEVQGYGKVQHCNAL